MPDANGNMTWQDLMDTSSGGMGGYSAPSTMQYSDTSVADSAAKNAYYAAQSRGSDASSALAAAKQAWQQQQDAATLSGYFSSGYGYGTYGGQPTFPNQQYSTTTMGAYQPGGLGAWSAGSPTQSMQNQQEQYGLSQAGVTGVYNDPGNMTYRPGTFVRDPSTGGIGQIQSNGQMQMFGSQGDFLRAGGSWDMVNNPDMMRDVDTATYNRLAQAPGQNGNGTGGTASTQLQSMYGTYGMPTAGSPTMALQAMYGTNAAPGAGQQTLGAQNQYWNQSFQQSQADITQQNWQKAFEAQQGQNTQQNTLAYLQQLASLRGPADWAKYQQVLGSTPNGMRDMYAAAMGQYIPGGGATTGVAPQAANLNTMQQQMGGQGAGQTWGSGIGIGAGGASGEQAAQATGGGTNMMGGQQQQYNLPAPNQIATQSWNNMAPSQQQMMLGMYEANGWNKDDVMALHNQSLPKYGTNNATAGTWRMQ